MDVRGTGQTWGFRLALPLAVILVAAALVACGGSGGSAPSPEPSASPMTLKVMEFNIEYGGTQVSFAKVVAAVKKAQPDVIGLEEAETNTGRLAKAAGYPYWSNATQVISRYPTARASGGQGRLRLRRLVQPGRGVALANVHLPSDDPGPQAYPARRLRRQGRRDGDQGPPAVHSDRSFRSCRRWPGRASPPSWSATSTRPPWRDYTPAVVGTRDYVKYGVEWPVSKAVEAARGSSN